MATSMYARRKTRLHMARGQPCRSPSALISGSSAQWCIPNWTVTHAVSDARRRGVRYPTRGGSDRCGAHRHPHRRGGRATPVRQDDPRPAHRRTRRPSLHHPGRRAVETLRPRRPRRVCPRLGQSGDRRGPTLAGSHPGSQESRRRRQAPWTLPDHRFGRPLSGFDLAGFPGRAGRNHRVSPLVTGGDRGPLPVTLPGPGV